VVLRGEIVYLSYIQWEKPKYFLYFYFYSP
jgi:hypothetical protein